MPGGRRLRLATRGSAQARTQTTAVADAIRDAHPDVDVELVIVDTFGDRTQQDEVPLHTIGGLGVFVKEVQVAVLRGEADAAVHSAKDLPSTTAPGLRIAAFSARRDPADALVGSTLDGLADGAVVATGSVRRRAQLAARRPDLDFVELRGNIHTRLAKIPPGGAIVMAAAALEVLDLTEHISERLDVREFVPSPGQGCVAIECRSQDESTSQLLACVDHAATRRAVVLERAFLAELGSGCSMPVGAHVDGPQLAAFLASEDRARHRREVIDLAEDVESAARQARALAMAMRDAVS